MIRRGTWITLGVFAVVLLGAVVISRSGTQETAADSTPTPEPLWILDSSEIVGVKVEDLAGGRSVEVRRDEEDLWQIVAPETRPADAARVEQAVTWLASPSPRTILLGQDDLSAFGLAEPLRRVTITTEKGETFQLDVGRDAPTGGTTYATSPGNEGVLLFRKFGLDDVLTLLDDLLATPTLEGTPTEPGVAPGTQTPHPEPTPTEASTQTPTGADANGQRETASPSETETTSP